MKKAKVEILQSTWEFNGRHPLAISINDVRYGPDAGPWNVVLTTYISVDELIADLRGNRSFVPKPEDEAA